MSNRKKSSAATTESDEVEQLLQAAQDEMVLKLSVDNHMSRVAPDYLDPDLHHRFQALRSRPSTSQSKSKSHSQHQKQSSSSPPPKPQQEQKENDEKEKKERKSKVVVDEELKGVLGDDLSARFAALKASLSSSSAATSATNEIPIGIEKTNVDDDDQEDEVEKVIQWAMDSARLDPSPPSDDDDDDHLDSDSDNNDSDDDDDDSKNKNRETKTRK
ncbi:hypothetical protein REPUB_Repub04eG0114300 [Reevesia pubescens]